MPRPTLLRFSAAAAQGTDIASLIRLFCRETREFFQVSGVYFWQCLSPDEMVGAEAYDAGQLPPHVPMWRFERID